MEVTPNSSTTSDDECHADSMHNAVAKRQLKDAFVYCDSLLQEADIIDIESSATISADAMAIGEELYQSTVKMLGEKVLVTDEDFIHFDEVEEEGLFREVEGDFSDNVDY
ncbi:hypothetical protein KPH14_009737 [Odynerus spinipes]|uniref:Uncharacterized protein n=1 Tax=Odynerus spinipes TaxID=1348599 RepID=A0AAD9VIX3_9HYME|nr:hypothetical protein KPH14_009737 [Odynerus spinipes]